MGAIARLPALPPTIAATNYYRSDPVMPLTGRTSTLHGTLDPHTMGSALLPTLLLKGEPKMRMYSHKAQYVADVRVLSY